MKTQEEIEKLAKSIYGKYTEEDYEEGYLDGYNQCQEDMAKDQTVTRFEVIDENGRVYNEHHCNVELSYQDDGRTLKVFINSLNKQNNEN
jgi:flagellar biosynthesis/type III secretory pathway protein FliH